MGGARLPTEAEWESAAEGVNANREPSWMILAQCNPRPRRPKTEFVSCSATCGSGPASAYLPYPGFRPAAGAVGEYNAKFMSGQFVLGAEAVRLRAGTCVQAIAIFSIRTNAGNLPASGSQRISSYAPHRRSPYAPILDERPSCAADPVFRHDVVKGLAARPRAIPARWFYDRDGSALFEQITTLPEYYLTRTERTLLQNAAAEIAAFVGPRRAVVEFGAGSCSKTRILFAASIPQRTCRSTFQDFSESRPQTLSTIFSGLPIHPIEGDFTNAVRLPTEVECLPQLGFFPGSTIGNLLVA